MCREQANIVYYRQPPQKPASKYKTNEKIQAQEVRVIDADGQNLGVLKTEEAVKLAKEKGLDLIEIAKTPKGNCRQSCRSWKIHLSTRKG